jgi:hypothetical protein
MLVALAATVATISSPARVVRRRHHEPRAALHHRWRRRGVRVAPGELLAASQRCRVRESLRA